MKIVCGSCQAKYSIADEKVAGKVFKIRCKRCGEVIVVRGDQDAPPEHANGNGHVAASPAAYEAPADAIWHVVINGEQAGPYAPMQLGELIHAGQLDWDAYVWCEGFENWLPMREVTELVNAISGQRGDDVTPAPVTRAVQPAGGAPSMGADPFADETPPPQVQVQMYAKPVAQAVGQAVGMSAMGGGGGGGAQAAATLSAFDPSPAAKVVASSPRVSAEQAMTGARNENSVLFSLKNLQALATGSSAPAAGPSLAPRPGYAGGEGSGLIDIRALATATGVNEQSVRPGTEKDALLSLGSAQAGAFGALGSPMLAPPGRSEDEGGKKGLMFAVLGGIAMLAVAGIAIAMIMRPAATPAPVAPIVPPPSAAALPPAQPSAAPSQPAQPSAAPEAPSEGEQQAAQRALMAKNANAADDEGKRGHTKDKHGSDREKPAAAEPESRPVAAKPEPEAKPEKPKHTGNSIDDLLNDAIKGGGKPGASSAAAAAASNLPEKPTRDDVLDAMKGVQDAVKACSKGQSGVAFANVTVIGKTGRVSNVEVTGMTGDVGSCIARSVRKASFPKFKSDNFQVKFPFRL